MTEQIGLKAALETATFSRGMTTYISGLGRMTTATSSAAVNISGKLKTTTQSTTLLGSAMSKLGSMSGSVVSGITRVGSAILNVGKYAAIAAGAGGLGLLTAGVIAVGATGLNFNNTMEQTSARIQAFTKDAEQTAAILDMIKTRAAQTPFAFEAMSTAAANLLPMVKSSGVALQDMIAQAEILAASNPAEGLEGAAFALKEALGGDFVSAVERFNLPRQLINQLKKEGVPAMEIVSRAMQSVGLDADLVSGLANTAAGRWSTFKDTLTGLSATLTQPIFNAFSGGLGNVNNLLAEATPQLEAMANLLAGQVQAGIEAVTTAFTKAAGAYERFGVRGATVSILGSLGFSSDTIATVTSYGDAIEETINRISGAYQRFGARGVTVSILGMLGMSPEMVGQIFTTVDQVSTFIQERFAMISGAYERFGLRGATTSILGQLGMDPEMIGTIFTTIENVSTTVSDGFDKIASAYERFGLRGATTSLLGQLGLDPEIIASIRSGMEAIQTAIASVSTNEWLAGLTGVAAVVAGGALAGLLVSLGAVIASMATPVVLLGAAVGTLGMAWAGNWFGIRDTTVQVVGVLQNAFNTVSTVVSTVTGIIKESMGPSLQEAFNNVGAAVANMGITWERVGPALATAVKVVGATIGAVVLTVIGVFTSFVTATAAAFAQVTSYAVQFQTGIGQIFTGLQQIIAGSLKIIISLLTLDFAGALEGIKMQAVGAWTVMQGAIRTATTAIQASLTGLLTYAGTFTGSLLNYFRGIGPLIGAEFTNIVTAAEKALDPSKWAEMGVSMIDGLLEGIKSNMDKVIEIMKGLAAEALQAAKDAIGFGSPAKKYIPLGQSMIQGLTSGVDLESPDFKKSFIDGLDMGGPLSKLAAHIKRAARDALKFGIGEFMPTLASGGGQAQAEAWGAQVASMWGTSWAAVQQKLGQGGTSFGQYFHQIQTQFNEQMAAMKFEQLGPAIQSAGAWANFGSVLAERMKQQYGDKTGARSLRMQRVDLEKSIQDQIKSVDDLTKAWEDSLGKRGRSHPETQRLYRAMVEGTDILDEQRESLRQTNKELDAYSKSRVGQREESIASLRAVLAEFKASPGLQDSIASVRYMGTDWTMNQAMAQQRLNELVAEEREEKEAIAALDKAKADLAYLQEQYTILKMVKEMGLDWKTVFQGAKIGLEADSRDMLLITSNLVNEMVRTLEVGLEMGSPSRVMDRIARVGIIGGLARGLVRGKPMVMEAMRVNVNSILSMTNGLPGGSNYYNTTNNNINVSMGQAYAGSSPEYGVLQMRNALQYRLAGV